MNRKLSKTFHFILLVICILIVLNMRVTTRQGVNYQVRLIRIPLYLKVLDFFDRYYNYKELTKTIIKDARSDEEKVMRIFEWAHNNIRKAPKDLPILDDHVWYTIVRGYGVEDQFQDIFTTLCNLAGIDAYFTSVFSNNEIDKITLSFVKIQKKWCIFDAYRGIYFKDNRGKLADIESKGKWSIISLGGQPDIDYTLYLDNLPTLINISLSRASIQSPLKRFMFELKQRVGWFN